MFKKNMIGNMACPLSDVEWGACLPQMANISKKRRVERRWSDREEKRLEGAGELNG